MTTANNRVVKIYVMYLRVHDIYYILLWVDLYIIIYGCFRHVYIRTREIEPRSWYVPTEWVKRISHIIFYAGTIFV